MKVTVFGAGGNVGRKVVALALERGCEVTAFVHRSNPLGRHDRLTIVTGDINDAEIVAKALQGSDAAISCLGSWHTRGKDTLSKAMKRVIPAMQANGIPRLITLTGAGAFYGQDKPNIFDRLNRRLLLLVAPKILMDAEAHLRLLEASSLDWTTVRSPVMTNSGAVGYRLRDQLLSPLATIPRAAVVSCLVDLLTDTSHSQRAPLIYRP